jgi:hypothetical protein
MPRTHQQGLLWTRSSEALTNSPRVFTGACPCLDAKLPIELETDDSNRFVAVRASGAVTLQDALGHIQSVLAQGVLAYPKLVDAREAEPSLSESDMEVLGDGVRALGMFHPRGPIAAVASTPQVVDFFSRLKQVDSERRPLEVFDTVEAAMSWLASRS